MVEQKETEKRLREEKKPESVFGKFKSIQSTMMVSFSLLMIVAVLIFLLIALSYTNGTIYENTINYTSQIIRQVNYDIDAYMDYMENISSVVAKSGDVARYLFEEEQTDTEYREERERILSQFQTIMESRGDIYNIAVVAENGKSIINGGEEELTEYIDIRTLAWYQEAMASTKGIAISSSHVQNAIKSCYKWVITLSRTLINNQNGEKEGIFFVDLNYSAISDLCNRNNIGNKGYVFILDEEGNVVYHPKQQLMYGGLLTENISEIMECDSDYLLTGEGRESKIYTLSKSEKTGWTVVGAVYSAELLKNNKQAQILYLLVAAGLLLGTLIVSNRLSRVITRPIRQLRDSMSTVEEGEFDKAGIAVTMQNEIGSLTRSFNVMIERIHLLVEQNRYEQEQKRKSELRALQAQINPHFLYNTLDSIIWMSEAGQNEEVVVMTSALARLFRQSISNDQEQVFVEQEIEYVRSYLTIQKMRYQDKLEYSLEVDPAIFHVMIVKFTLQPLVENAIYHGIKWKENKGNLTIRGYKDQGKAVLVVEDDGVGMDEETQKHIFEEKAEKKVEGRLSNGVGIFNVQKRLQLYYGPEYGISYQSKPGEGTRAVVKIPLPERLGGNV
ncbi:MAG: histidine kinase [Ruminococcus sp.]|nr:histidine kinase [Ruminococcus sp.]